jgi:hypothetical protein
MMEVILACVAVVACLFILLGACFCLVEALDSKEREQPPPRYTVYA